MAAGDVRQCRIVMRSKLDLLTKPSNLQASLVESMMREIGAFEAKNRLGSLLDAAEHGEEITITRRGRAVARLVPAQQGVDREKARAAAARIIARSRGVTLGGISLKELVGEGRL